MSTRKLRNRALEAVLLRAVARALGNHDTAPSRRALRANKRRGIVLGAVVAFLIVIFPVWSAAPSEDLPHPPQFDTLTQPAGTIGERGARANARGETPRPPPSPDASDLFLDYLRTLIVAR